MPTRKEILVQQEAESSRAERKERIYIAAGFVVAFCAAYGAARLFLKIEPKNRGWSFG
jgi:hypothetical protein